MSRIDYGAIESVQSWWDTQQYLAQKKHAQQQITIPAPISPFPQAPVSPDQQAYISSLQQQQEENKPGIQHLFELIGRPEAATRGAIQAAVGGPEGFAGGNPAAGFMTGLTQGQEAVPGYSEMAGVRDLPGPLPQIVEKIGSTVLDPLNLVPAGRLVGGAGKAAEAIGLAGKAAPAISVLSSAPGRATVEEMLAQGSRQTAQQTIGEWIRAVPLVGNRVADTISPRLGEQPGTVKAIANAYDGSGSTTALAAEMTSNLIMKGEKSLVSQVDDEGRLMLRGHPPVAENDVWADPKTYRAWLPPEDFEKMQRLQEVLAPGGMVLGPFKAVIQKVRALYGGDTAKRLDIGLLGDYAPRYMKNEATGDMIQIGRGGQLMGITAQHGRTFDTAEEALQTGYHMVGQVEANTLHVADLLEKQRQGEALIKLEPYIKAVGTAAKNEFREVGSYRTKIPGTIVGTHGLGEARKAELPGVGNIEEIMRTGPLEHLWAEPEIAAQIRTMFTREDVFKQAGGAQQFLGLAASANTFMRTFNATGDISASFLQNLPTLLTDPARGMAALYMGIRFALQPSMLSKMYASPAFQEELSHMPGAIVGTSSRLGGAYEALNQGGGLTSKLLNAPGIKQVMERSEAAFTGLSDFSWFMGSRAMRPYAEAEGRVPELVDFLNHSLGRSSARQMGISPQQRAIEGLFQFAPAYGRASAGMVADLLNGRLAGREAANTIGSMLVFGLAGYNDLARMLGQQPELDPRRGSFLTIDVGGERIGIGTPFRSMVQLLGHIEAQIERNPQGTGGKEEFSFDKVGVENPLIRLARSRLSPAASTFADWISGETFTGTPLTEINPLAFIATRVFPFALGGFLDEHGSLERFMKNPTATLAGVAATGTGLRAFPEQRADVLDNVARDMFSTDYKNLTVSQQAQVRASDQARAVPQPSGERFAPDRERDNIFKNYANQVGQLAARVNSGGPDALDLRQFRNELSKANDARDIQLQSVDQRYQGSVREPTTTEGRAYEQYRKLAHEPGANGLIDYEAADTYLASQPASIQAYIKERLQAGIEMLPANARGLVRDLYAARDKLQPYWDVFKQDMQKVGLWDQWHGAPPEEQDAMRNSREMARVNQRIRLDRDRLRLTNPEIDALLVKWGYVSVGIRERGRAKPSVKDALGRIIGLNQ